MSDLVAGPVCEDATRAVDVGDAEVVTEADGEAVVSPQHQTVNEHRHLQLLQSAVVKATHRHHSSLIGYTALYHRPSSPPLYEVVVSDIIKYNH